MSWRGVDSSGGGDVADSEITRTTTPGPCILLQSVGALPLLHALARPHLQTSRIWMLPLRRIFKLIVSFDRST
jgi:hypothetical protein